MKINAASAVAPVAPHKIALDHIATGLKDEVLGPISMDHIQLCPQHAGYISENLVGELMEKYPETKFRLHASPKLKGHGRDIVYVSNAPEHREYLDFANYLGQMMGATGHTVHSGERDHCDIDTMLDRLDAMQQRAGAPIGVEGLYPTARDRWLMSRWSEYERVAERGSLYAIDLSHLNIVAKKHGRNDQLVEDLLSSSQCIEVHVSANDGRADSHRPLSSSGMPWWHSLLAKSNPDAIVFYEGVLVDPRRKENQIGSRIVKRVLVDG